MIYDIVQTQDKGKTLLGVAILRRFISNGYYQPEEVYSNIVLTLPGCHIGTSEEIAESMVTMVEKRWKHKIFFLDEIDRLFPARWWNDKERTHRLLGLWQDVKLFHRFISTRHATSGVDKLFRDAAQLIFVPNYMPERDLIDVDIINSLDARVGGIIVPNASKHFGCYLRWEPVY